MTHPIQRSCVKLVTENTSASTFQSFASNSDAAITSLRIGARPEKTDPAARLQPIHPVENPLAGFGGIDGCA
jgi:hypothetical protein